MTRRPGGRPVRACLLAGLLAGAASLHAEAPGRAADAPFARPHVLSPHYRDGGRFMGIRLLGALELSPARVAGRTVGGLSGLAWDDDEEVLYALSDAGWVLHLAPRLEDGRLVGARALALHPLRDERGRPLGKEEGDAEGLLARGARDSRRGDTTLVVSFERRVRIARFTPRGELLGTSRLPPALRDAGRYASPNRALEALAEHPALGVLSAPEAPMRGMPEGRVRLFALDGRSWDYPLHDTPNAALVAAEALPGGALLTLERGHGLFFVPVVTVLRVATVPADTPGAELPVETVAVLDSSEGWSIDNFEGLTRHRGRRFYMVSDDNFGGLQKTILVYFELLETAERRREAGSRKFEPVHESGR